MTISWKRELMKGVASVVAGSLAAALALGHDPTVNPAALANLSDWCIGAPSNEVGGNRVEDTGISLVCGNCNTTTSQACEVNSDCPAGQTCVNTTSKEESAFWDNRTDGAVNDLATVAITTGATNLYVAAELWIDPDPVSLPFGLIGFDVNPGGLSEWHDPNDKIIAPGRCSVFTDRACTRDADCHFCAMSTEPFPSNRPRTCGSGCNPDLPGDVCQTNQTCQGLQPNRLVRQVGIGSDPVGKLDFIIALDFSLWLSGLDGGLLLEPGTAIDPTSPWDPVTGCAPDFAGDLDYCDFPLSVDPGFSGGSGGPPGAVEFAVPWSAFPPGTFGPGDDFRFTLVVVRGTFTTDFKPDGGIEDVMSEAVGGATTTTTDSCPGFGIGTTSCEIDDLSTDAFYPPLPPLAHEIPVGGRIGELRLSKSLPSITLDWTGSCSASDTDYAVYEGLLGSFASHLAVAGLCSTGGATAATFVPAAFSTYYLVVPRGGGIEGSYGTDSAGVERPQGGGPCAPQMIGSCP